MALTVSSLSGPSERLPLHLLESADPKCDWALVRYAIRWTLYENCDLSGNWTSQRGRERGHPRKLTMVPEGGVPRVREATTAGNPHQEQDRRWTRRKVMLPHPCATQAFRIQIGHDEDDIA